MITVDLANTIFILCLAIGGILLLLTILLEDLLGGIFESIGLGFDLGGVTLMPLLLAFVSMFGVGGLFGTQLLGMSAGMASLVGIVFGLAGAGLVWGMFALLRRAEAPPQFSLDELIGQRGRVSVAIPAGRAGAVLISYAGSTHDVTATADEAINQGALVTVTDVAGTTLVVKATPVAGEGGSSDV